MRKHFNNLNIILIFCLFLSSEIGHAQLGFCQGNSGDPIFSENFGTGTTNTALTSGTTSYTYANGVPPDDGLYTVSNNTNYFDWFNTQDHTPDDTNGRMLIVNSDFSPGEFYRTTINGLCENTSYEFSSWILNLSPANGFCGAGVIPVNVRFEIWDTTDTNLLASGNTGNIGSTFSPNWQQYALVFQTIPSQTSVILKMINNGSGGCGNDLALDDIVFKSCGDFIEVNDTSSNESIALCSSETPYSTVLTAIPDNTVFSNHFYQWQQSTDGVTWTDITGETNQSLSLSGITSTFFYRTKVAEFASNLNNLDCITFSNVFELIINQAPTMPSLDCWETATFNSTSCAWDVTGTQPPEPTNLECWESTSFNTSTCSWDITGTQPAQPTLACWETAIFNMSSCSWDVTGTQPIQPTLDCWETATFNSNTCAWEVTGTQPPEPTNLACWEVTNFNTTTCNWEVTGSQPVEPTNLACWETTTFNTSSCSWDIIGTQPTQPTLACWETATFNSTNCAWEVTGVQPAEPTNLECWETATFDNISCSWEISGTQIINTETEVLALCEDEVITLQASQEITNASYQWNSGETTASINVSSPGTYTVISSDGCFTIEKIIIVEQIETPIIGSIQSDGRNIVILTTNSGNFLYSIDGINYQVSSTFFDVNGGKYDIYVKSADCDTIVTTEYLHFFIPKYFTPNDDLENDTFSLAGIECYASSEVYIFNRYGKLLFSAKNRQVNWPGTFNNKQLPTSDYWYLIIIEGQEFRGHFTLKR